MINKPFPLQAIKGKAKEATQNIKGKTWRSVEDLPGIWVACRQNLYRAARDPWVEPPAFDTPPSLLQQQAPSTQPAARWRRRRCPSKRVQVADLQVAESE